MLYVGTIRTKDGPKRLSKPKIYMPPPTVPASSCNLIGRSPPMKLRSLNPRHGQNRERRANEQRAKGRRQKAPSIDSRGDTRALLLFGLPPLLLVVFISPHKPNCNRIIKNKYNKMTLTRKRTENLSVLNTSFAVKGASFGKLLGNWQKWEKTNTEDEEGFEKICSQSSHSSSVRNSIHSLNSSVAKSTILSTMKTFTRSVCSVLSEESMTSFTFAPDEFHEIYEVGKEVSCS